MKDEINNKIRDIMTGLGADVCGIANALEFRDVPSGFSPVDVFMDCRSVIVLGFAMPRGLADVEPRLIYNHFNNLSKDIVDKIAMDGAKTLEKEFDCHAVPLPGDGPYEAWDKETLHGHGLISVKHAAVKAGLGSLGKSTIFLNPQYGNLLTLGAILTSLELKSDPPCEDICIKSCTRCIDECPVNAIRDGIVDQYRCRTNAYGRNERGFETTECNRCRSVCPMRFGKL
jgi:Uncharacterized Fe-S protein